MMRSPSLQCILRMLHDRARRLALLRGLPRPVLTLSCPPARRCRARPRCLRCRGRRQSSVSPEVPPLSALSGSDARSGAEPVWRHGDKEVSEVVSGDNVPRPSRPHIIFQRSFSSCCPSPSQLRCDDSHPSEMRQKGLLPRCPPRKRPGAGSDFGSSSRWAGAAGWRPRGGCAARTARGVAQQLTAASGATFWPPHA
eukprot:COSAG04_NODE_9507_length_857_cov_1.364116_1_plen_197_part_00